MLRNGVRTLATKAHHITQPTRSTPNTLTYAYLPVAVVSAKKKTYFELFCVPVFPIKSKHVWVCGICQWRVPLQQGYVLTSLSPPPLSISLLHCVDGNHNSLDRGITTHLRYNGSRGRLQVSSSRGVPRAISPHLHKGILPPTSRTCTFRAHTRQSDPYENGSNEPILAISRGAYASLPFASDSSLDPLTTDAVSIVLRSLLSANVFSFFLA